MLLRSVGPVLGPVLVVALTAACAATWDLAPIVVPSDLPRLPAQPELDYRLLPGTAHAALPLFDPAAGRFAGNGRIWLKGSAACPRARIAGRAEIVQLEPPFYTAVVDAPPGGSGGERTAAAAPEGPREVAVEFLDAAAHPVRTVQVAVTDAAALNGTDRTFGALFFGDFQPFVVGDGGEVHVNPGPACRDGRGDEVAGGPTTLLAVRAMFERAARGRLGSFPRPSFACGVGDQVYVEGDYHSWPRWEQRHPMSAWTVEAQPRPRVGLGDLPRFLDVCYRAHWSFAPLEAGLQACPSVMTWDDHDIRDGWGSQGDERVYRDSWFRGFRQACTTHQFERGPRPVLDVAAPDAALWQSFVVRGVPVFVLDLRTCRDIAVPQVLGEEQWQALRQWFAALDPATCRHYVLVSSVPLFFRVGERANIAAAFSDEVRDDLLDTWTSAPNEPEWRCILEQIATAGDRGLRGVIVSGDYHITSLCRVTARTGDEAPRVLAYELITAGLAADGYSDWKQRLVHEGWLLDSPIELGATTLHVDTAFSPPCPAFGGLSFRGEDVDAFVFEASEEGCFEECTPLTFEAEGTLGERTQRSRVRIDTVVR